MTDEARDVEYEVAEVQKSPELFGNLGMLTKEHIQRAEVAAEMLVKVKAIALKVTNQRDWQRYHDAAYLTRSGCEKVANLFGVEFSDILITPENKPNYRRYTAKVKAHFNGRTIEQIGNASSDQDLYKWLGKKDDGVEKPFEERNFAQMEKHAVTNAMNRALKAILGLDGLLWTDVEEALGRERAGKAGAVNYKQPQRRGQPATAQESGNLDDLKKKADQLLEEIVSMEGYSGGDDPQGYERAQDILQEVSSFPKKVNGKATGEIVQGPRDLTDKRWTVAWLQRGVIPSLKKKLEELQGRPPEPGSEG